MTKVTSPKPLASAPPPMHTVAMVGLIMAIAFYKLPTLDEIDAVATKETFQRVVFPNLLTVKSMGWIRVMYAITFLLVTGEMLRSNGWAQTTSYKAGTKLLQTDNKLTGWRTLLPFTSISWNLLGIAFATSGYITLSEGDVPQWLLRMAYVSWELAAPFSVLVAFVVRYAIWPAVLAAGNSTAALKSTRNKFMHNFNVLFAVSEVALLGGIPIQASHISLATIFGCLYVILSWNVTHIWNTPDKGPQFIYFFLDTTMPGYFATIALVMLLMVLMTFYSLFVMAEYILSNLLGGSLLLHIAFCVVLGGISMRFRD